MSELNLADLLRNNPGKLDIPGAALMKYGPEDYVGATLVLRGSLYFQDAHTGEAREALCQCFDEYKEVAADHLRWLWRDEPPKGPNRYEYSKAPKLRELMKQLSEDHHAGFGYVGGDKPHNASAWQFQIFGRGGWQAKLGNKGVSTLDFSVSPLFVAENPLRFQQLFVSFCRRLKPIHGHGGYALQTSLVRDEPNEPAEALFLKYAKGIDVVGAVGVAGCFKQGITTHLKTIGWLTAINHDMVEKIGGLFRIRSELPLDWFALYDYGAGLVIQAGPKPNIAAVADDPLPATYVLPNMLLKEVRVPEIGDLHYGSKDGEPRIVGKAAEDWLARFDIPEDQLLQYKAKLLDEPKLTKETTLPERLMPPR
jgi:hypothetical protein